MTGPMFFPAPKDLPFARATQMERFEPTLSGVLAKSAERGFDFTPGSSAVRMLELQEAQQDFPRLERPIPDEFPTARPPISPASGFLATGGDFPRAAPRLSEDAWRESEHFRSGLKYPAGGWTEEASAILAERFDRRRAQDIIISRSSHTVLPFLTEVGVNLLDPISIASSFVPIVGEARFAGMVARTGINTARAGRGLVEGFVGNLALEPIVAGAALQDQADYGMSDALLNVAFGTVFGAGLHVGGGRIADVVNRIRGRPTTAQRFQAELDFKTVETAFRTAVGNVVDDVSVDVAPVIRGDPSMLLQTTTLGGARSVAQQVADVAEALRLEGHDVPTNLGPVPRERATTTAAPEAVLRASSESGAARSFPTEVEARRVQRRLARRGEALDIEQVGTDEFVLTRTSPIDLARLSTGEISTFKTERAARKVIERTGMEDADVVPIGPPGPERRFAIARGASAQTIRDIRADPARLNELEAGGVELVPETREALLPVGEAPSVDRPLPEVLRRAVTEAAPTEVGVGVGGEAVLRERAPMLLTKAADPEEDTVRSVAERLSRSDEVEIDLVDDLVDDMVERVPPEGRTEGEQALIDAADEAKRAEDLSAAYERAAFCMARAA